MLADELSKALQAYQRRHDCTLSSMARKCNISHHKLAYIMRLYTTEAYRECNSIKVNADLEDGLRMMGIRIILKVDEKA